MHIYESLGLNELSDEAVDGIQSPLSGFNPIIVWVSKILTRNFKVAITWCIEFYQG